MGERPSQSRLQPISFVDFTIAMRSWYVILLSQGEANPNFIRVDIVLLMDFKNIVRKVSGNPLASVQTFFTSFVESIRILLVVEEIQSCGSRYQKDQKYEQ